MLLPTFQAQNPNISGYKYGWASCTSFSGAMAASYDKQVLELLTGGHLRDETGDFTGGLTLAQIDTALTAHQGVNLDVRYRLPWADFAARITAGQGAVLQGWYAPIAVSRFDAGNGFKGNHAVFVPPGWGAMDPLADGRFAGVYKYHGEAYPQALLKDFAGKLNIGGSSYQSIGAGLVYAAFTGDRVSNVVTSWQVSIHPATGTKQSFWIYSVSNGAITGRRVGYTAGFSANCTAPRLYAWPGHSSRSLVRLTSGARTGYYLPSNLAREV